MFLKTGDYESGIETLVGAISLIKQSPTAAEERCQVRTTPVTIGMNREILYFRVPQALEPRRFFLEPISQSLFLLGAWLKGALQ